MDQHRKVVKNGTGEYMEYPDGTPDTISMTLEKH